MRTLIALVTVGFVGAITQTGVLAEDPKKEKPNVVRVLKGWKLDKLGGDEDSKTSPAVYKSLDEVAKAYPDKEFLAKLDKEVDFSKNVLLRYAWKGGGPPVSYEVKESKKGPIVVFTPNKERTADLIPGSLELVIPADVYRRSIKK
jgi:hypothetical protein